MSKILGPLVLCILDGWGNRKDTDGNAIYNAKTPFYDDLIKNYPNSLLKTSSKEVGLPKGQMGNSEVGHMNIGAGRVVEQELVKIDYAIKTNKLSNNIILKESINKLYNNKKSLHLIGLLSPGGVHSHQSHILNLIKIFSEADITINFHAILDGRDVPPMSALNYVYEFEKELPKRTKIATISGRYYAMDRDERWERTAKYFNALCLAEGPKKVNSEKAIKDAYKNDLSDEFILPTIISDYNGIEDDSGLLLANFRSDRIRQISSSLVEPEFNKFIRKKTIKFSSKTSLTFYSEEINKYVKPLFVKEEIINSLGEVISQNNLSQLRIAETEKYAHVTFFFNGGKEKPFLGEERILIPSPKVKTYDLKPEMSADELTEKLSNSIIKNNFNLIVVNFANPDMVGHTGNYDAAIKAVETIDNCISKILDSIKKTNGALVLTSDHGNIECMNDIKNNQPHTAHTTEDVPLVIFNLENLKKINNGRLADVAPTILEILEIEKPIEMTGKNLAIFRDSKLT
ncbi:2,3-bisphosphoglycerate-independent phosphoglycerate mutase [Alphaproteobacteria bacterium]|nr:2,3-bisphosphoglycerate-independent phosphoglycerate mutase [Alphaproteobacteria bacterium]